MSAGPLQQRKGFSPDYFRVRDFEYAQPLYDLAFLSEVEALSTSQDVQKHRNFSLWRAAYRLDGYASLIDQWLDGKITDKALDHVPSSRIRRYLEEIRATGSLHELSSIEPERSRHMLRLRAIRGLGAKRIAELFRDTVVNSTEAAAEGGLDAGREEYSSLRSSSSETWQAAHIVPPLLRLLHQIEVETGAEMRWQLPGIKDGIQPVCSPFVVLSREASPVFSQEVVACAVAQQPFFTFQRSESSRQLIQHQQGWTFWFETAPQPGLLGRSILQLAKRLDPLIQRRSVAIRGDLHLHTVWSDGNSDICGMAVAVKKAGREYFAITDHSRSCKIQGGLTPVGWLRQAASLRKERLPCRVFHGIEVDILGDGSLDLPEGLLRGMDLVIGSVHGNWTSSTEENTLRLIRAIESGLIDIIGHPTAAVIGKPGVPNYIRARADVDWPRVFRHCAHWRVALELNCFPSRLDLSLPALRQAVEVGCSISLGSDAHARSHLLHLRFGEQIVRSLPASTHILNELEFDALRAWIAQSRALRARLPKTNGELFALGSDADRQNETPRITATLNLLPSLPDGSTVVGIDLTAGRGKASGIALLDGNRVETASLVSDDEILRYIARKKPRFVSIDSPLGYPGGGSEIDPAAGIVRMAERDLASVGISAYPALIDSMRELTIRGIALKRQIEALPDSPTVIESYPGAAQDILSIPRKQISLELLRDGLRGLGLIGRGLQTRSHDEMDAITSAIVGRFFEVEDFEPMGLPREAQLIVPKLQPLAFETLPVFCLAGRSGSGKTIVARYLAAFFGFKWIRTRDVIRALLLEDLASPPEQKMFHEPVCKDAITEDNLRAFGLVVLKQYQQLPLRDKLMRMIAEVSSPVVVDSVRDIVDVDPNRLYNRAVRLWYIDTSESRLRQRLAERGALTGKIITALNPIDQNAALLRGRADCILSNDSTLEELRWQVDDALFTNIRFRPDEPLTPR